MFGKVQYLPFGSAMSKCTHIRVTHLSLSHWYMSPVVVKLKFKRNGTDYSNETGALGRWRGTARRFVDSKSGDVTDTVTSQCKRANSRSPPSKSYVTVYYVILHYVITSGIWHSRPLTFVFRVVISELAPNAEGAVRKLHWDKVEN